jgi:hypothetical protein
MKEGGVLTFKKLTPMVWFLILAVITAGLALGLPPDPQMLQRLHISSVSYRLAVLVLLVPYGIIWYAAFYAYAKLKEYARAIKGSEDGKAFRKIMVGMGLLAFGLVIPTTVSLVLKNIASHNHGFRPAAVIVSNYVSIALVLAAFTAMSNGTRLLTNVGRSRSGLYGPRLFALSFLVLSVVFTHLVLQYHARHPYAYYLNTFFLIATFVIPYLFIWFMALLSAYEFGLYAKHTKGLLYCRALRQLSYGITVVIAGSVAAQFIENTFVAVKANRSLGLLLLVEYVLLAIIAFGLVLMALGTNKLKKIEEV